MRSIAQFCYRRRRYVVAGWVLLLVGALALSTAFSGEFSQSVRIFSNRRRQLGEGSPL